MELLRFNEEKVFVDSVDDQLVALLVETGSYYTFSEAATAVVNDLAAGYTVADVQAALRGAAGAEATAKLDAFLAEVLAKGIMEEHSEAISGEKPAMSCATLTAAGSALDLSMEGYDDIAAYFMVDPIHEVDPNLGWPNLPQE